MSDGATPGQTVGPFFGISLPYDGGAQLVPPGHPDRILLTGRVFDGAGAGVPDALLEIWQPGPDGAPTQRPGSLHRDGVTFTGFGRAATDDAGRYEFCTLRPGAAAGAVPFIAMTVFARGLLDRLFTRVYLPGTEDDTLLASLPAHRRRTLIAADADGTLHFDVRLQGADETVFLRHE